MGPRYAEGYTKGVHDEDATEDPGTALIPIHSGIGLLRFTPAARATRHLLFWEHQGRWNEKLCRKKIAVVRN